MSDPEQSAADRHRRAKALLRVERSICEGIAEAEAHRVAALAAESGAVPSGAAESVTASLARMAHMRALQAVADVLALAHKAADTEVRCPAWTHTPF